MLHSFDVHTPCCNSLVSLSVSFLIVSREDEVRNSHGEKGEYRGNADDVIGWTHAPNGSNGTTPAVTGVSYHKTDKQPSAAPIDVTHHHNNAPANNHYQNSPARPANGNARVVTENEIALDLGDDVSGVLLRLFTATSVV